MDRSTRAALVREKADHEKAAAAIAAVLALDKNENDSEESVKEPNPTRMTRRSSAPRPRRRKRKYYTRGTHPLDCLQSKVSQEVYRILGENVQRTGGLSAYQVGKALSSRKVGVGDGYKTTTVAQAHNTLYRFHEAGWLEVDHVEKNKARGGHALRYYRLKKEFTPDKHRAYKALTGGGS